MSSFGERLQQADWKLEKHVPVITCPETVPAGQPIGIGLTVGKEIAHPNTPAHHIKWIDLYFHPDGAKFPFQIGSYRFEVHGEAPGDEPGPVAAVPSVTVTASFNAPGVLFAVAYCNIHGLWESQCDIRLS